VIKSRRVRWEGRWGDEKCIQSFGPKTLKKEVRRWEDNIKIGVKEIGRQGVYWIRMVLYGDLVNTAVDLRVS
jgi:hypothetical protein